MGDNHLSEQEGIKPALLSAYCVGNWLCYDEQCADAFSVCISFTVWAAACRTSLLHCGTLTQKETHQAHFVWLIGYPPVTNAAPPRHQTSLIKFWCDPPISIFAQWLLSFLFSWTALCEASLLSQFNWFKNQSRHREWDTLKKESFEECADSDPGLVIVSESRNRRRPSVMFFGENKRGMLIGFFWYPSFALVFVNSFLLLRLNLVLGFASPPTVH